MRRNSKAAETSNNEDMLYELNITPRASLDSQSSASSTSADIKHPHPSTYLPSPSPHPHSPTPTPTPPQATPAQAPQTPKHTPSIRLLFSLLSRRHRLLLLTPAVLSSLLAGGIAPFMTVVVGQAFDAFAQYPLTPSALPPSEAATARDVLLRKVGLAALELVGLAIGSFALGSTTSALWIWVGERNTMVLRRRVYESVCGREMAWFDMNMGTSDEDSSAGPVGAGGLMAKFSRETDDVRTATSLASGTVLQYLTTTLAALALAFTRSWSLTLVILSAVPLLMLIQAISQGIAAPLLHRERDETARAATSIDRAVSNINTVKAFSASSYELARASRSFGHLQTAARRLNGVWGLTSGLAQFVMMGMFVQGFWFGAKLVRDGRVSAGDVMAVFWACLIATSNLQMCIPGMITLAKGKVAMVSLLELIGDEDGDASRRTLRKITPEKVHGELALHSVSFAYPSRPSALVLSNVSLFLPAHETTFIVGASGSGKSTVAQLLLRMYQPQPGTEGGVVLMDEQDMRFLDEEWVRRQVVGVGQQGAAGVVILEGRSVWENVLVGLALRQFPNGYYPSSRHFQAHP